MDKPLNETAIRVQVQQATLFALLKNEATLAVLREHGCDGGQGFFIGHPMGAVEAERWMRASAHA